MQFSTALEAQGARRGACADRTPPIIDIPLTYRMHWPGVSYGLACFEASPALTSQTRQASWKQASSMLPVVSFDSRTSPPVGAESDLLWRSCATTMTRLADTLSRSMWKICLSWHPRTELVASYLVNPTAAPLVNIALKTLAAHCILILGSVAISPVQISSDVRK
jgi:hypothetical protein